MGLIMLCHFSPFLHCVLVHLKRVLKVKKVKVGTNRSSSIPQKTLRLKRPISSAALNSFGSAIHHVTHLHIDWQLVLQVMVRVVQNSCSVVASGAGSGMCELTNQSRLGIQEVGLELKLNMGEYSAAALNRSSIQLQKHRILHFP